MSEVPHGEGHPLSNNPDVRGSQWPEGRNVTQIAALLAAKLTHDEMYDLVLAIESSNLHDAVVRQWQNMEHPRPDADK